MAEGEPQVIGRRLLIPIGAAAAMVITLLASQAVIPGQMAGWLEAVLLALVFIVVFEAVYILVPLPRSS